MLPNFLHPASLTTSASAGSYKDAIFVHSHRLSSARSHALWWPSRSRSTPSTVLLFIPGIPVYYTHPTNQPTQRSHWQATQGYQSSTLITSSTCMNAFLIQTMRFSLMDYSLGQIMDLAWYNRMAEYTTISAWTLVVCEWFICFEAEVWIQY